MRTPSCSSGAFHRKIGRNRGRCDQRGAVALDWSKAHFLEDSIMGPVSPAAPPPKGDFGHEVFGLSGSCWEEMQWRKIIVGKESGFAFKLAFFLGKRNLRFIIYPIVRRGT